MDPTTSKQEYLTKMAATPDDLKKVLEWELTLDNNDLRSHAWYHGTIPRQRAEELMSDEGDFLIRDCISRPGDYVLTCKWKSTWLHFVINKVVFQPFTVYEKVQYQFEDDCFDTVPDLVTYYVGNKRPISAASGAIVSKPVNRSMPLSYYATRYGLECQIHYATIALEKVACSSESRKHNRDDAGNQKRMSEQLESSITSDADVLNDGVTTTSTRQSNTVFLSHRKNTTNLLPEHENTTLPTRVPVFPISPAQSTINFVLKTDESHNWSKNDSSPLFCQENSLADQDNDNNIPPPKPSRTHPTAQETKTHATFPRTTPVGTDTNSLHLYSEPTYPKKASDTPVFDIDSTRSTHIKENQCNYETTRTQEIIPELNPHSNYDLQKFTALLLPLENKPLDPPALARMRCMLLEFGSRVIASHLTKADVDILRVGGQTDMGLGVVTGYELILLPQGHQLRLDLLERTECLKYFVAITVLTCGDEEVRSQILNKWIQVAIETKTALGNLYGFTGIMQGLALPQISRLRSTWLKLRQTCTENAFTYETKLRPTMKTMQECSNPQAPNTCVPYLMSILLILQRHFDLINGNVDSFFIEEEQIQTPQQECSTILNNKESGKVLKLGLPWEFTSADYGLQLLLAHLEVARTVNQQWQTYRRNSEIVLENAKYDELMLDMFRTEFHLKFLWGLKGSQVSSKERYLKLAQVLTVMSERCEPI